MIEDSSINIAYAKKWLAADVSVNTFVFFEKEHFLAQHSYERYKTDFEQKTIIVFLQSGQFISKSPGEQFSAANALIHNYVHYRDILSVMQTNSYFVSLHAASAQQMVILSNKYGSYNIGYKTIESRVESLPDLKLVYDDLVKNFAKVEYVNFFKDVVIDGTHNKGTPEVFWEIVTGLNAFLVSANRDYQIYVQTFAFDKIKSKFKEEKVKYFESLEKNIESLNKQVAAFPLTFAASAFAGFQVKDNAWILIIITIAYSLYTWVAWEILAITRLNIDTTKSDVAKEANKLEKSYKIVFDEFKDDFKNIQEKIKKIEILHGRLKTVLIGLLVLFVIFACAYGGSITMKAAAQERAKQDSIRRANQKTMPSFRSDSMVTPAPAIQKPKAADTPPYKQIVPRTGRYQY